MQRYKIVHDGYILGVGFNCNTPISNSEYRRISLALKRAPEIGENQIARLRDGDLVWVIEDIEPIGEE